MEKKSEYITIACGRLFIIEYLLNLDDDLLLRKENISSFTSKANTSLWAHPRQAEARQGAGKGRRTKKGGDSIGTESRRNTSNASTTKTACPV